MQSFRQVLCFPPVKPRYISGGVRELDYKVPAKKNWGHLEQQTLV